MNSLITQRRCHQPRSSMTVSIRASRSIPVPASALPAVETEHQEKQRPQREANEENDDKGCFHRMDRKPSFALINHGTQGECGKQF